MVCNAFRDLLGDIDVPFEVCESVVHDSCVLIWISSLYLFYVGANMDGINDCVAWLNLI